MITYRRKIQLLLILIMPALSSLSAVAQSQSSQDALPTSSQNTSGTSPDRSEPPGGVQNSAQASTICGIAHVGQCLKDLGHDQAGIWTSPLRITPKDAIWLVPFAAGTAVALHYDAQAQQDLGIDKTRIDTSSTISDVGLYGSVAGAGGLYLLGSARHNDHLAETGRLGEEAVINALLVVEGLKLATNRERPNEGDGRGGFWPHGTRQYEADGSFPSGHAAATWAFAQVIASEYTSKPVQIGAYAFALAISASRVTAREHFPSDVLVGGTFGYLIGRYVVHHHGADSQEGAALSVGPVMQESTKTFGLHLEFTPGQVNLSKVEKLLRRTQGAR